jgi:nitric oxide reductase NorQ protein
MSTNPPPWYHPVGNECALFETAFHNHLPMLLKGPTGCGKSRLVEHMAAKLGRKLVTVACHDDTSATDLVGRYLVQGGDTIWQDGPLTRAVRQGAILYLDEIAEARPDVVVVIHPLTDHRRQLLIERHDEELHAPPGFMLVVSYNPGYQRGLKELKPSTRQRFVGAELGYPPTDIEVAVIEAETKAPTATARRLVALAQKLRELDTLGLAEVPSTRLLVHTARLMQAGVAPRAACEAGVVEPLTDDREIAAALRELVALVF